MTDLSQFGRIEVFDPEWELAVLRAGDQQEVFGELCQPVDLMR